VIRVLIAEDQAMVRGALASLLSLEDDIEVVAEVERGDAVLDMARTRNPNVDLLDIEMPDPDDLRAAGLSPPSDRDRCPGVPLEGRARGTAG
jgi:two-component system response regulator DesR